MLAVSLLTTLTIKLSVKRVVRREFMSREDVLGIRALLNDIERCTLKACVILVTLANLNAELTR